MKKEDLDKKNSILNIKNGLIKKEWNIIGSRNIYRKILIRKCPKCKEKIIYRGLLAKYSVIKAEKNKSVCCVCSQIGKKLSTKHKKKIQLGVPKGKNHWNYGNQMQKKSIERMKKSLTGRKLSKEHRKKISESNKGKIHSKETREKLSKANKGHIMSEEQKEQIRKHAIKRFSNPKNNPMYGKRHKLETKRKIRLKRIERLKRLVKDGSQLSPNYNINACQLMDKYGKQHGYKFQHAKNGGEFYIKELGYWADGYDKKKNVIFEFDEKQHFIQGKLKPKDLQRMTEIKNHLKCKFIRYNERTKEIKKY